MGTRTSLPHRFGPGTIAARPLADEAATAPGVAERRSAAHKRLVVLLLLTMVAFALRLFRLGYFNLSGDETITSTLSIHAIPTIIAALRNGEPHPPLLYLLYHFWIPLTGDSEVALRFPSVAVGTATVPLIAVVGRRLLSGRAGYVAAALLAVNPYQLWNAQDARMYALLTWLCLCALYAMVRTLGVPAVPSPKRRWPTLYGLSLTLALYAHYYSAYAVVLLNLFAIPWLFWRDPRRLWPWLRLQIVVGLIFLPWLALGWVTITTYHGLGYSPTLRMAVRRAIDVFALGYVLPRDNTGPIFWLFVLLLVAGTAAAVRRSRPAALLLLLALLVPIGGVFLASRARPVFNERYLMAASPSFYLLIAAVTLWGERSRRMAVRWLTAGSLLVLGLASLLLAARYVTATTTVAKARNASVLGAYLAAHVSPTDLVIFNTIDPTIAYYYRRAHGQAPSLLEPTRPDESAAQFDDTLGAALAHVRRVWLVPDGLHWWDRHGRVSAWLDRHTRRIEDLRPRLALELFSPERPLRLVRVRFGPAIELTGVGVPMSLDLAAGQPLSVTLFWRAVAPVTSNETVTVQVQSMNGRLVAQQDGPPRGGTAPTSSWRMTETIPDRHRLVLPLNLAPGSYRLVVALYDPRTLRRLTVAGVPSDAVTLATVMVSAPATAVPARAAR